MKGERPARLFAAMALALLLALVGCSNPSEAPTDPGKAVVSVRFEAGGSQLTRTGTSLGDGRVVTAVPWTDKRPAFDRIEILWSDGKSQAEIAKVEENWGIVLLRTRQSAPPGLGSTAPVKKGDKVRLLGRGEEAGAVAPSQQPSGPAALQEVEGEVTTVGTSLPDLRSGSVTSGPFLEVRVAAQPSLVGGLVLDSQRRPVAVVRLVQVASSGKATQSYALPLEELRGWAPQ